MVVVLVSLHSFDQNATPSDGGAGGIGGGGGGSAKDIPEELCLVHGKRKCNKSWWFTVRNGVHQLLKLQRQLLVKWA